MTDVDIICEIIEDFLSNRINIETFSKYYYLFYNYILDDEDFGEIESSIYKKIDDLVTFYDNDNPIYPYVNNEKKIYNQTESLYTELCKFYNK